MAKSVSYEKFIDQNCFYTKEEIVNLYGNKTYSNFINSLVVKDENLFRKYKTENLLTVNTTYKKKISAKLLRDLLSDDGMYRYLKANLEAHLEPVVIISYLMEKETFTSLKLSRTEIIAGYTVLVDSLNQTEKMRFALIKGAFSLEQNDSNENTMLLSEIANFEIPESIMHKLDEDMDKTYSVLEKAIYYYFKLYEVLTCEAQNNTQINWYEFILIYTKLMSLLNLKYTLEPQIEFRSIEENTKLSFNQGEYQVTIKFFSDKPGYALENLICTNENELTQKKFSELCIKIFDDINNQKSKRKTFQKALKDYKSWLRYTDTSLNDKIFILLKELSSSKLAGIEITSYAKKLFNNLFADSKNISLNILGKKAASSILPIVIISLYDMDYFYYLYDDTIPEKIKKITEYELTELLSSNQIYYIEDTKIPGITKFVGEKYVR